MENSGKFFFEDDGPHWFVANGDNWIGPLAASDIHSQIQTGILSWAHFVWKSGQKNWTRICDTPAFQTAVPQAPKKAVFDEIKHASETTEPSLKTQRPTRGVAPPPMEEQKPWFLYYSDTQYGPFSTGEVTQFLASGKINPRVHVWKDGMKGWEKLESVAEFRSAAGESKKAAPKAPAKSNEQRSAPRAPLVAKIVLAAGQAVSVAVCRDISVGGMQVLTDRIPGGVGTRVKLNVSSSEGTGIEPFVAEGVIVRVLEDKRGFSFRFEKLPDKASKAIQAYISASGA
jgi:hypothetical protein